jgi:error-prone DNA polymerase
LPVRSSRAAARTAIGFILLSNADETGISNAIIHPELYEQNRATVTRKKFLLVEGVLQHQGEVVNVRASVVPVVDADKIDASSHDFY